MKNIIKKALVLIICLLCISIVATETCFCKTLTKKVEKEEITDTKTVTLYRHGFKGEITQVETQIKLKENMDIEKALEKKCKELFEEDNKFQNYIKNKMLQLNNSNLTLDVGLFFITSHGKGFHFKTKWVLRMVTKYILFKLNLPSLGIPGRKRILFCSYENDPNALTNVTPIISLLGNKNNTVIDGNHTIAVLNFRGFTTWPGRFTNLFSLFTNFKPILSRAFYGITPFYTII